MFQSVAVVRWLIPETMIGSLRKAGGGICRTKYPAQDKLSCSTGLAITPLDYWFPPEEPRRSQRTPGGVWFVGSPPITNPERNAAMIETTPPAPSSPAPVTTPTPAPLASGPPIELNPAQAEKMISWFTADLAAGRISPEAATKAFGQLGATPEQLAPDQRTDEQKQLDAAFPPAKPGDYIIRYGGPGEDVKETPELKQFDSTARTWLSEAQFPREVGNSLVNAIARAAQQTQGMTRASLNPTATPNLRSSNGPTGTRSTSDSDRPAAWSRHSNRNNPASRIC